MAAKAVQLGKSYTFAITGITIDQDTGVVTVAASPVTLTGKAKRASLRFAKEIIQIDSLDATIVNNLALKNNWTVSLTGIQFRGTGTPNKIQDLAMNNDYMQIVVTSSTKAWTFQGTIQEFNFDLEPGEVLETLTLVPFDNGGSNPTYA